MPEKRGLRLPWRLNLDSHQRQAAVSGVFLGALVVLCAVLGVLQYRWIGEVSLAARDRMRGNLTASLIRLSRDFNSELSAACQAIAPESVAPDAAAVEQQVATRFEGWKAATHLSGVFRHVALAEPQGDSFQLRSLDLQTGAFHTIEWPAEWATARGRIERVFSPGNWPSRFPGGMEEEGTLVTAPLFRSPEPGRPPEGSGRDAMRAPGPAGGPPMRFGPGFEPRGSTWLILDLDPEFLFGAVLEQVLQRHLGSGGAAEYQIEILTKGANPRVLYLSDAGRAKPIVANADASVDLFEVRPNMPRPRDGKGGGGPEMAGGPGPIFGRWRMYVQHRSGSLEAVVARARWRNLAVTGGVLLLMVATVAALIRFTRKAQTLAQLQMDFVAGVSHELRTPLTVINTAGYNLQSGVAHHPAQVARYGALIQQESGRLKDLVEQILRFSRVKAGHVAQPPTLLSVEKVIEETVESSKGALAAAGCELQQDLEPALPLILGDATSLKHALGNLLGNAAKYGTEGSNWIGLSASKCETTGQPAVEIRVADRGPGIPADEQARVFDAFFRGRRAVRDQVHGTGLGLSLVKEIVEAHKGTVVLESGAGRGAVFIVRIPAAPPEYQDDFSRSTD